MKEDKFGGSGQRSECLSHLPLTLQALRGPHPLLIRTSLTCTSIKAGGGQTSSF